MGQYAGLNTELDVIGDMLLDEDFDQLSQQEEWLHATSSNVIEFMSANPQGAVYEF